jgi:transcriptional regulator with XRE-family HTH domain
MRDFLARPEKEPKTALAIRLREVRRQMGDPERSTLEEALGVSVGAIARYERGDSEPTAAVIAKYRAEFGISFDWLLTGEGEMYADPSKAPKLKEVPGIDQSLFRQVGRLVIGVFKGSGVNLPPDALLDEQSGAYNALLARAEDPDDKEELTSLLPWLEARLKKQLSSARAEPGTGKHQA